MKLKWTDLKAGDVVMIKGDSKRRKVYVYSLDNENYGKLYLSIDMYDEHRGNWIDKFSPNTEFYKVGSVYLSNQGTEINV